MKMKVSVSEDGSVVVVVLARALRWPMAWPGVERR
jgi:hypothetical protein